MGYESTKCIGGSHTECMTHTNMGYIGTICTCPCHFLSGPAREVLTAMCENVEFRATMLDLVNKQIYREDHSLD